MSSDAWPKGLTNREIAKRLRLSHHTIKNYLFRIFDKVGVSSRVELLFLSLSHPVPTHVAPQEAVPNTFVACRQSAEAGSPLAQLRLANRYRDGIGTTPDPVEAYMWALICEKTIQATDLQVRKAKNAISRGLLHHEVLEAERRADDWCRAAGKADNPPFQGNRVSGCTQPAEKFPRPERWPQPRFENPVCKKFAKKETPKWHL